ncbi:hypothetical protein MNV49_003751 [Pseudohyphozyma bogoriensis]|nr:hypothetical protein MNV49_003751 [Pseudohyphozyma bogoriensis]
MSGRLKSSSCKIVLAFTVKDFDSQSLDSIATAEHQGWHLNIARGVGPDDLTVVLCPGGDAKDIVSTWDVKVKAKVEWTDGEGSPGEVSALEVGRLAGSSPMWWATASLGEFKGALDSSGGQAYDVWTQRKAVFTFTLTGSLRDRGPAKPTFRVDREIKITSARNSTYRAVLVWLQTSHIAFAPLSSSFHPSLSPTSTRLETLKNSLKAYGSLPVPVSPKSVYRLTHLLELPRLGQMALEEISSQLTVDNVALELFSSTSEVYAEVRKVELDFAVRHWAGVKKSKGMAEIERRMEAGEDLPNFGKIMWEINKRI